MNLTKKQQFVLEVIVKGNPDGSFCDLDEVIARVPYRTTKASIQFIIRNLIGKGLIEKHDAEKRRSRRRVVLGATPVGYKLVARKRTAVSDAMAEAFV